MRTGVPVESIVPAVAFSSAMALAIALATVPSPASAADPDENLRAAMAFARHANAQDGRQAAAKPGVLLVDCIVNGMRLPDLVEVEVRSDLSLIMPLEAWRGAGLLDPEEAVTTGSGTKGVKLDGLDGVTYSLDVAHLTLSITAAPTRFAEQRLRSSDRREQGRPHTGTGVYLDYDLSVTAADDGAVTYGGATRAVVFSPKGSLVAGAVLSLAFAGRLP